MVADRCEHLGAIETVKQARRYECDECVKTGDEWVHLRTCQECGGTHCCDNSPNRHATSTRKRADTPWSPQPNLASAGRTAIPTRRSQGINAHVKLRRPADV